jgi:hypothetical protein
MDSYHSLWTALVSYFLKMLLNDWYDYVTLSEWMNEWVWHVGSLREVLSTGSKMCPMAILFTTHSTWIELGLHLSCAGRGQWLPVPCHCPLVGYLHWEVCKYWLKTIITDISLEPMCCWQYGMTDFYLDYEPVSLLTWGDPWRLVYTFISTNKPHFLLLMALPMKFWQIIHIWLQNKDFDLENVYNKSCSSCVN